jgi:hypothetical protein
MLHNLVVSTHKGRVLPQHRHRLLYTRVDTHRHKVEIAVSSLGRIDLIQDGSDAAFHLRLHSLIVDAVGNGNGDLRCAK